MNQLGSVMDTVLAQRPIPEPQPLPDPLPDPRLRPVLIGSEIYRRSTYGANHPLAIPRVSTALDLMHALGWVAPGQYVDSPRATRQELLRFHHADYLAALERTERTQQVTEEDRARHRIGAEGNPVYREIFSRPRTSAGGVLLAARLTEAGGVVHVPGGGTHHGRADRASGFCYLNDAVLGLMRWLDQGLTRILYLDIDAHHGDGVQDAFHEEARVLTISLHEAGRWPRTGLASDRAGGMARNFPVPEGFDDHEFHWLCNQVILPLVAGFRPQAIMLQCGADAIAEDPLSRLLLSNNAHRALVAALMGMAPRLIVLGGGGYNPWSVARCWAGVWGVLNGHVLPPQLPAQAEAVLRALRWSRAAGRNPPEHWFTTLADPPREGPADGGAVRDAVKALAANALL